MEKILSDYLEKVEKYLRPLPVSERVDIVQEIKSEIVELQSSGASAEEIVERLGNPKALSKAFVSPFPSFPGQSQQSRHRKCGHTCAKSPFPARCRSGDFCLLGASQTLVFCFPNNTLERTKSAR